MAVISVRGTNGSSKSTVVRKVMAQAKSCAPIYGGLGPRAPEAYALGFDGVEKLTFLLGPYHVPTGGADSIQPYDLILELIEKYAARGNVLFEGVIVSSSYGRVGTLMEKWGKDSVFLFLNTPLETCIARVEKRRSEKGVPRKPLDPTNLTYKYKQCLRGQEAARERGTVRVESASSDDAPDLILRLLRGEA